MFKNLLRDLDVAKSEQLTANRGPLSADTDRALLRPLRGAAKCFRQRAEQISRNQRMFAHRFCGHVPRQSVQIHCGDGGQRNVVRHLPNHSRCHAG